MGMPETIQFEPCHDLSRFGKSNASNFTLDGVYVDAENGVVVATDARVLARVPIGKPNESFFIPAAMLRVIGDSDCEISHGEDSVTAKMGDATVSFPSVVPNFVNWQKKLDELSPPIATVNVDARLLREICDHAILCARLAGEPPYVEIKLRQPEDAVSIRLTRDDPDGDVLALYEIMPLNVGSVRR